MTDEIKIPPADSESNSDAAWHFKEQVEVLTGRLVLAQQELTAAYAERDFLRKVVLMQSSALENWSNR